MRKIIIEIIIGGMIFGAIGVIAATTISSKNVIYQDKTVNNALDELYDSVNLLKTKGDAVSNQILTGKKAIVKGIEVTGTMPNRGNLNWAPSTSTSYTVPSGYYSGGTLNSAGAYNTGYNAGVTAADNRANTNSTNYKTGYNAGYSAGGGGLQYKSGVYNTHLNGETVRSTSFNTGLSSITAIQVRSYVNSEYGDTIERDNRISNISISGGTVTVYFYAGDYCENYIKWLAVGK